MTKISPPSLPTRLAVASLLAITTAYFLYKSLRHRHLHRRRSSGQLPKPIKIFFASETGTSESLARRLSARLSAAGIPSDLINPLHYEPENLPRESAVLFIASTWQHGSPPPNAAFLARWLSESASDFRAGSLLLSRCRFAVFGVGSRSYGLDFNAAARGFVRWMKMLGAGEMARMGDGDVDGGMVEREFDVWSERVLGVLNGERSDFDEFDEEEDEEDGDVEAEDDDVVDLEDIVGKAPRKMKGEVVDGNKGNGGIKEMVTPIVRKNLEKQVVICLAFVSYVSYVYRYIKFRIFEINGVRWLGQLL